MLGEVNIYAQSSCFLRCIRPLGKDSSKEAVDYHRETFYSDNPDTTKNQLNIWIPIKNVVVENSLPYIPGSHKIPDSELITSINKNNNDVARYSTGHKMGFLWKQRQILDGVDLNKKKIFEFPDGFGSYAAFSAMTIHGDAQNKTKNIRFVIAFSLIPKSKIRTKELSFASGKSYFTKL